MVTLAGGMESDFSDSECEDGIVFSTDAAPSKSINKVLEKKVISNGSINNFNKNDRSNQGQFTNYNRNPSNANRNFNKFNPQNRSKNNYNRRQCLDFKSSQVLDDLRFAIMQGNLGDVQAVLAKGVWVDTILKSGWTSLMYACSFGQFSIVSYLLAQGADPNYHKDMFTALMAACGSKKSEEDLLKCCTLLLDNGAKVDARERHFTTPLMFAVREGYSVIVKELLDHGADPNVQDSRGRTALAWAASTGHGQIIRMLLERGSDVNIYNQMGQSPADVAYESGHNEVASLLKKGCNKETNDSECILELEPKKEPDFKEISTLVRPADSKNFVKVGELELFLSGLGLPEVVSTFVQHHLSFHDLLIMDDSELEKIGISQVGVRKKILEACKSVHKKEWEKSSLPNLKQSQYISCPDAVAMMANIAKHLKYISSSVIYIRQQIQSQPRILELSQDSANVYNLQDEMDDSLKNVRFLNDELRFLKLHLEKVQDQVQYIPADLIVQTIPKDTKQKRILYTVISTVAFSAAVAGILWKYPEVVDLVSTSVRVKLPSLT